MKWSRLSTHLFILPNRFQFALRAARNNHGSSDAVVEIEKKFRVSPALVDYCERNATSIKNITLIDTYYDSSHYDLTTQDMWLRERNGKFELKVPAKKLLALSQQSEPENNAGIDFYDELIDETNIKDMILKSIPKEHLVRSVAGDHNTLKEWMKSLSLSPFVKLTSERKRFSLDVPLLQKNFPLGLSSPQQRVSVDIDTVTYDSPSLSASSSPPAQYVIGEIELASPFVSNNHNLLMREIFQVLALDSTPVRGKLLEFLFRYRPEHYAALQKSGQLQGKGITEETK